MGVMSQLEGAFAMLVKSRHHPGELVACKRGSPLILGVRLCPTAKCGSPAPPRTNGLSGWGLSGGEAVECFLASDASAVVEHTKT